MLHEGLLVPVLLLGIRRMDRVPNARFRELCEVAKEVHERINEIVLRWFPHFERMIGLLKGFM